MRDRGLGTLRHDDRDTVAAMDLESSERVAQCIGPHLEFAERVAACNAGLVLVVQGNEIGVAGVAAADIHADVEFGRDLPAEAADEVVVAAGVPREVHHVVGAHGHGAYSIPGSR